MLNNNFYRARQARGLGITRVASDLDVTEMAVRAWEQGKAYPRAERLSDIADLYGVSIDYLLDHSLRLEGA